MASSNPIENLKPFTLDSGTLFSLAVAFSLMPAAQLLANYSLPRSTSRKYYYLFLWHTYDFLTHFIIEGSYLYHCFFSYIDLPKPTSDYPHPAARGGPPVAHFLGQKDRRYGAIYSTAPMARLWQEYAKADHRWGVADTTVISLELLTVCLAGPMAVYICYLIFRTTKPMQAETRAKTQLKLWFVAIMLATGELYGGFMTFAPEWLSGSTQLATDDPVYLWLYLFFFNTLWVWLPLWVLYAGFNELSDLVAGHETVASRKQK